VLDVFGGSEGVAHHPPFAEGRRVRCIDISRTKKSNPAYATRFLPNCFPKNKLYMFTAIAVHHHHHHALPMAEALVPASALARGAQLLGSTPWA